MKVYIFGNKHVENDRLAFDVAEMLQKDFPDIEFVEVKPNEDLPFVAQENQDYKSNSQTLHEVILIDVVHGIKEPKLITMEHIDKIILPPRSSVHDFDLGFQLKYLRKLGKLGEVKLIGLPIEWNVTEGFDYSSIHSIFKKLVAQDIQGS